MRQSVRGQPSESKIGRRIEKATILQTQRDVFLNCIVRAYAVDERRLSLELSAGQSVELVPGWTKHKYAGAGNGIGADSRVGVRRKIQNHGAGQLVNAGLNAKCSGGRVFLSIEAVPIGCFRGHPPVEVVAIGAQESAALRRAI